MNRVTRFIEFAAVALIGWTLFAYALASFLTVEHDLSKTDAIVVLGGSADYKKRSETAASLLLNGVAPTILVTNDGQKGPWDTSLQRNPFNFERTVRQLEYDGVPDRSIEVIPQTVESTNDEAELITDTITSRNFRSITLVTSGFHTRRALWSFSETARTRGIDVKFAVESPSGDNGFAAKCFWWLSLSGWRSIPPEAIKLIYYRAVY